jgi:hypothetical protein
LNNTLHNYPIFHRHIQKLGGYILSTVFLDFVYLTYILIFAEYLNVLIRLRLYFQFGEKLLSFSRLFADDASLGYSSQNVVEILASLDKVTPKCLWLVVIGILFPLNVKLKLFLTSSSSLSVDSLQMILL